MSSSVKLFLILVASLALFLGTENSKAEQLELAQYGNPGPYVPAPYMPGEYPASQKSWKPSKVDGYNRCMDKCNELKFNCEHSISGPKIYTSIDAFQREMSEYENRMHSKCDPKVEACTDKCDKIIE